MPLQAAEQYGTCSILDCWLAHVKIEDLDFGINGAVVGIDVVDSDEDLVDLAVGDGDWVEGDMAGGDDLVGVEVLGVPEIDQVVGQPGVKAVSLVVVAQKHIGEVKVDRRRRGVVAEVELNAVRSGSGDHTGLSKDGVGIKELDLEVDTNLALQFGDQIQEKGRGDQIERADVLNKVADGVGTVVVDRGGAAGRGIARAFSSRAIIGEVKATSRWGAGTDDEVVNVVDLTPRIVAQSERVVVVLSVLGGAGVEGVKVQEGALAEVHGDVGDVVGEGGSDGELERLAEEAAVGVVHGEIPIGGAVLSNEARVEAPEARLPTVATLNVV